LDEALGELKRNWTSSLVQYKKTEGKTYLHASFLCAWLRIEQTLSLRTWRSAISKKLVFR
jgi:hypothetical protein